MAMPRRDFNLHRASSFVNQFQMSDKGYQH